MIFLFKDLMPYFFLCTPQHKASNTSSSGLASNGQNSSQSSSDSKPYDKN